MGGRDLTAAANYATIIVTGSSNPMTNTMTYKGYSARIEYDDDGIFTGRIAGIRRAAMAAQLSGKSLNQWAEEVLDHAASAVQP